MAFSGLSPFSLLFFGLFLLTYASASPTFAFQALAFPALTSLAPFSLVQAPRTSASPVPAHVLLHHLPGAILPRAEDSVSGQKLFSFEIPGPLAKVALDVGIQM